MICIWCSHETAAEDAAVLPSSTHGQPQCTVCRQSTTKVRGGHCLSQFQICVCVSGLVLSVSKFSPCQSASGVTKSLRSPVGASFQSVKKKRKAVC